MALIEVNWKPDGRQLRRFGIFAAVILVAVGGWAFWRHALLWFDLTGQGARTAAVILWCVAGLCVILAAAAPRALLPLYWLLSAVGLPIGVVVSYLLMALLFFGIFTPIALCFRLIGRDALCRKFDRDAASYWVRRRRTDDVKRYFRQF